MMDVKRNARALARRAAVEVLARTDPGDAADFPQDTVLLLHQVHDHWMPKMEAVVEMLAEHAEPATYTEICAAPSSSRRFTVTFDDGNKSQMAAAKRLSELGVSACFFIISDAVDADSAAADRISREQLWIEPEPFMDRSDLDSLLEMGHEVGSHTRGHANLARLSGDALVDQIAGSVEVLKPWMGDTAHFAWPYGRLEHTSRAVFEAVSEAGFATCAAALRGSGVLRLEPGLAPIVLRQSLNLDDSLAVQRRFIGRTAEASTASEQSLVKLLQVA